MAKPKKPAASAESELGSEAAPPAPADVVEQDEIKDLATQMAKLGAAGAPAPQPESPSPVAFEAPAPASPEPPPAPVAEEVPELEPEPESEASLPPVLDVPAPVEPVVIVEPADVVEQVSAPPPPAVDAVEALPMLPSLLVPAVRRYRVWPHGELHRNGVVYGPGAELELTPEQAASIPCLSLVE